MPRGRRKLRGGVVTTTSSSRSVGSRPGSQDSSVEEGGPRREKESRLSTTEGNTAILDSFFRSSPAISLPAPETSGHHCHRPDFSGLRLCSASPSNCEDDGDQAASSSSVIRGRQSPHPAVVVVDVSCSTFDGRPRLQSGLRPSMQDDDVSPHSMPPHLVVPPVPSLAPPRQAIPRAISGEEAAVAANNDDSGAAVRLLATPPPLLLGCRHSAEDDGTSDQASDRSEGDSGKENDVEDIPWMGSRSSLNSRSSRASRPRSGPFSEINAANIHPLSAQTEKKSCLTEASGGRVTRSSRSNAAEATRTSLAAVQPSLAQPPADPVPVPRDPSTASATSEKANQPDRTAPYGPPVSPLKQMVAGPAASQSPLSPHKIQLPQPRQTLAEKLKSAISKSPKTLGGGSSSSTKKGQQPKTAAARKAGSGGSENKTTGGGRTKAEKLAAAGEGSRQITDFFPIRRSERKPKSELDKDKMENIEAQLVAPTDDSELGLEIRHIPNKGRGVVATRNIKKGEFVVEYAGELIDIGSAKDREAQYSLDTSKGCYMYYFTYKGKQYCIDATTESGRYGRLLNHSCKTPNCVTKVVMVGDTPRLILIARQDIPADTELIYDYGDRSKESLLAHPWLAL